MDNEENFFAVLYKRDGEVSCEVYMDEDEAVEVKEDLESQGYDVLIFDQYEVLYQ